MESFDLFSIFIVVFILMLLVAGWTEYRSSKFKKEIVHQTLKDNFDLVDFSPRSGFDRKEIFNTKLIGRGNSYHSSNLVTINYRNHRVMMSDVHVEDETGIGENKSTYTIFTGQVFKITLPKGWDDRIYVIDRQNSHAMSGIDQFFRKEKYERFETESIGFNKEYRLYASNHQAALKLLTPEFIHDLELIHKENMSFSIDEDSVYITVYSRKNLFQPKFIKSESHEESEKRVLSEFNHALKYVNLFLDRS